jgi:hypothetical protein
MTADAWGRALAPNGEEPWAWRKGCIEALSRGCALGGIAAVGLENSCGFLLGPHPPIVKYSPLDSAPSATMRVCSRCMGDGHDFGRRCGVCAGLGLVRK